MTFSSLAQSPTVMREREAGSAKPHEHRNPSLYEINTRVFLAELSRELGRPATLDDFPEEELQRLATLGFDWIWMLGVWQTGPAGQRVSQTNAEWRHEFSETLADLRDDDIGGSCFAVTGYTAHSLVGGDAAVKRFRDRVHAAGMQLVLDFVPNHTALDHPWLDHHPEYYIPGTDDLLAREPQNYVRLDTKNGPLVLAYGRDPYFAGWPDTLQLNYAEPTTQQAMMAELCRVADMCDGVRCDMAMLLLPDVFERTWGRRPEPFWPKAIESVRSKHPGFLFMAEVYWDLEWTLQQQGFNYTYDKRLYDRLRDGAARPVREHLCADMDFQRHSVRFLENHDEPRAVTAFRKEFLPAAAILTFLCPGLRFFHEGQLEGRSKKISVHLCRRPDEPVESFWEDFYARLLECIHRSEVKDGTWQLLHCNPAWQDNWTVDNFICSAWQGPDDNLILVVVNYSPHQSQCFVEIPFPKLKTHTLILKDVMGNELYKRNGDELVERGLYVDLRPWAFNVFEVSSEDK